jgi:peptidoglycan hydrolase CwlO-like protein
VTLRSVPTRARRRIKLAALVFPAVLLAPIAGDANPAASGTATATSTLVRLATSLGTVSVASDDAQARIGASPRAYAKFISGAAADKTIGAAERTTTSQGDRQTATIGDDSISIDDLLTIGTAGASISTEIEADGATSIVEAQVADASLFNGWLEFDGGISRTTARSFKDSSTVHREISIGGLRALSLGALLAALDVSPLDLTCDAIRQIGEDLGHDASSCNGLLEDVEASIAAAIAGLQSARDDVLAQRDAVTIAIETAQAQLSGLQDQLTQDQADLATAQDALASLIAQRAALQSQLDGMQVTLADLQTSRTDLVAEIAALEAQTAGFVRATVQEDRDDVTSCDSLTGLAQTLCQANLLTSTFPGLATTYGIDLSGLGFTAARAALLASIDEVLAAFDSLDDANAELATVDAQIATLNAEIDDVQDQIATLDAQIAAKNDEISDLDAAIDATQDQIDTLGAQLDALNDELDALISALAVMDAAAPADTTCTATVEALETVAALEPTLAASMDALRDEVDGACGSLRDEVEALLDVPLITVDGITITLDISARVDAPAVAVTGTLGTVQIGENEPVVLDMPTGSDEIPVAQTMIADAIETITEHTGLGLAAPSLGFLVTASDAGRRSDGYWYAEGSVTFLRLSMPAGSVTVPDEPPLGPLEGSGSQFVASSRIAAAGTGAGAFASARGLLAAQSFDTPPLSLDLAVFDAAGSYLPAANDTTPNDDDSSLDNGGARRRLPKTGEGYGLVLPALCFAAAALLGRKIRRA